MRIAVIGGGAAGIMAAITAAKNGADVTLMEATSRIGNKILMTGNGKCNFANLHLDKTCYYCKDIQFLDHIFEIFSPQDSVAFFESIGMLSKEKGGYLYPLGEQASIVLDVLRLELDRSGVCVMNQAKVNRLLKENDKFVLELESGNSFLFDKVIVATGGRSYPKTGSDGNGYKLAKKMGHTIFPTVPALVQLVGNDNFYKSIAGVRSEGCVSVIVDGNEVRRERGEIQFTDYGISGIPVFQVSRIAAYGLFENRTVEIHADVLPDYNTHELTELILKRIAIYKNATLEDFMCGLCNKKIGQYAIKYAGYKATELVHEHNNAELLKMVLGLKKIIFHITDTKGYDTAQVTAGGVLIEELDHNLQSGKCKNLYFIGEMVDIDGICGGYNLHWAFASGYVAGIHSARK